MTRKRRRLAERRKAVGLSQERLAEVVGVDRSTVVRWERADTSPQPWHRPHLCRALKVTADALSELLADVGTSPAFATQDVVNRENDTTAAALSGVFVGESQSLLGSPPSVHVIDGLTAAGRAEHLLAKFLDLEAELGGDQLYAPLAGHVERLARIVGSSSQRQLMTAFAQLCQMVGWLAVDSNRHGSARRHLSTCVAVAHEVDDPALAASALAYLSLQETYRDNPKRALALAQTANEVGAGCGTPRTTTMLATRLARAYAKMGDRTPSLEALDHAEHAFNQVEVAPEPLWISYVDPVEVSAQRGACYLDLGMYPQALDSLDTAMMLMERLKPTHTRDRVHYLSRIAKCHLAGNDVEEACAVGHQAIDAALTLGSTRVFERLSEFDNSLVPYEQDIVACDFRERFALFRRGR